MREKKERFSRNSMALLKKWIGQKTSRVEHVAFGYDLQLLTAHFHKLVRNNIKLPIVFRSKFIMIMLLMWCRCCDVQTSKILWWIICQQVQKSVPIFHSHIYDRKCSVFSIKFNYLQEEHVDFHLIQLILSLSLPFFCAFALCLKKPPRIIELLWFVCASLVATIKCRLCGFSQIASIQIH